MIRHLKGWRSLTIKEGYFSDDGTEIDPTIVPIPTLCHSCLKNNDTTEEVPCMLNRMDQMKEIKNGEMFLCFAYEPNNPSINKRKVLRDMENYWAEQNRKYLAQHKRKKGNKKK
jgi:hypothetical protein